MNTPTFDPDDPRLTAYALGESNPEERAAVEELLAVSPEARDQVEQTRALVLALEAEYRQENEAYWDARREEPSPGKIVAFPVIDQAKERAVFAFAWKIAALLVALGVLLSLALRRWSSPHATTLASLQRAENLPPAAPATRPSLEVTPASSTVAKASVSKDAEQARLPAARPEAAATPVPEAADTLLAMDSDRARRDKAAAAAPFAEPTSEARQAARPSVQRAMAAPAPATNAPGGSAEAPADSVVTPVDRIARSTVQIRTKDGSYVGGVAVMADGWILAAEPLPVDAMPTVIRADHHEASASLAWDRAGLCWLRITGTPLPGVTLASATPAEGASLTVVSTDRRTGATRFVRAQVKAAGAAACIRWDDPPPTQAETSFAFDSSGKLLAMAEPPLADKAIVQTRSASKSVAESATLVRPFTTAERAWLESKGRSSSR